MKKFQEEKKSLPHKTTFDMKLEKLVNNNVHANEEVVSTVKLSSRGNINYWGAKWRSYVDCKIRN